MGFGEPVGVWVVAGLLGERGGVVLDQFDEGVGDGGDEQLGFGAVVAVDGGRGGAGEVGDLLGAGSAVAAPSEHGRGGESARVSVLLRGRRLRDGTVVDPIVGVLDHCSTIVVRQRRLDVEPPSRGWSRVHRPGAVPDGGPAR